MKRTLAAVLTAGLIFSGSVAAQASSTKSVEIAGVVKITYPKSIKLKARGCQNVKISYEVGLMQDIEYVYVGLLDDMDEPYGDAIIYETPGFLDPGDKPFKKKGSSFLKICREARAENLGDGDYEDYVSAKKGDVQIYVSTWQSGQAIAYTKFR
jgi:hypothetical protein